VLAYVDDSVVKFTPVKSSLTEGELFKVYLEEIASTGNRGVTPCPSNVWRVLYTDSEVSVFPHVRHYPNKERATVGFQEAVMFNGFLGLDKE
tara:strand:+ start:349 stop:624 length:276 start_codon:yes stop_codon:yes gene_type:complete